MKKLLSLFWTFVKVGACTFGGGMAMLPMLQKEVVERQGWASEEELLGYYAIGQCTPGIIAVNTATFVGRKQKGFWGGIFATLGIVFPSLVIIILLATLIQNYASLPLVAKAFSGIRIAVCALVLKSILQLIKKNIKAWPQALMALATAAGSVFFDISPIVYVAAMAVLGLLFAKEAAK